MESVPTHPIFMLALQHIVRLGVDHERRLQVELHRFREKLLAEPRYSDPRSLLPFGRKVYSQNDEDGIISEVIRRIGPGSRTFFEFGVADGLECNTLALLAQGWRGAWAEPESGRLEGLRATFQSPLDSGRLRIFGQAVTPENINEVWRTSALGDDLDVLSIDIDGNDIWVWRALTVVRPRLVVIEYNATWPPPMSMAVPYSAVWRWDGTSHFGASLAALAQVGRAKGYRLVACCLAGVNAFFVREDLCSEERFQAPFTAEIHYEPPRYYLGATAAGHRPGFGPLVEVP